MMSLKKCFLFLPLLFGVLTSCGGNDKGTPVKFDAVVKTVDGYKEAIKSHRVSNVTLDAQINEFTIDGDFTYWYYENFDFTGGGTKEERHNTENSENRVKKSNASMKYSTLLALIPNFTLKGGKFYIDKQKMLSTSIPGELFYLGDSLMDSFSLDDPEGMEDAFENIFLWLILNLPKYPLNSKLIELLDGFKLLPEEEIKEKMEEPGTTWLDYVVHEPWKESEAKVTYTSINGGIYIDFSIPNLKEFIYAFANRLGSFGSSLIDGGDLDEVNLDFPVSFGLSCNKYGYFDSLSIKFSTPNNIKYDGYAIDNALYLYVDAKANIDIGINFTHSYSKQCSVKYQCSIYEYKEVSEDAGIYALQKVETKDPSASLETFEDYFSVERFSNKKYDDPIFFKNYWNDSPASVAYEGESYDVLIVPKYDTKFNKDVPGKPDPYETDPRITLTYSYYPLAYLSEVNPDKYPLTSESESKFLASTRNSITKEGLKLNKSVGGFELSDYYDSEKNESIYDDDKLVVSKLMYSAGDVALEKPCIYLNEIKDSEGKVIDTEKVPYYVKSANIAIGSSVISADSTIIINVALLKARPTTEEGK